MMRTDLLVLTADDLTVLTNRGLVKRAQREIESGELTCELAIATDGSVTLNWSDNCICTLPTNQVISEGHCTCTATTICRHIIRSILAYQQQCSEPAAKTHPAEKSEQTSVQVVESSQSWHPGSISDRELAQYFNPKQLKAAQATFNAGLVVELTYSAKPTARFHSPAHTLRFLVPHDLRYTYCDCAETTPCSHVLLGVWAFRQLPDAQISGVIMTNQTSDSVPTEVLDQIETELYSLFQTGVSKLNQAMIGRLQRLEQSCRQQNLIWLAEILQELLHESERYREQDARFSPIYLTELIGELCIRSDAIRHPIEDVPQLLIRGMQGDRLTDLGATRLVGLGCGARLRQRHLILTAYFQDTDSGSVMAFSRDFTEAVDYDQLAQRPALKRTNLATLGSSQLLLKGGKRSPNLQLIPGRSPVTIHPQTFNWEDLRSPLLVKDFSELRSHLDLLPPAYLRPRRLTEMLYVFAVASVRAVGFNVVEQAVMAELYDSQQHCARLFFPYHHHARHGTELLLHYLNQSSPQFVAGQVQIKNGELWITPISLVFAFGTTQSLIQPWISTPDLLNQIPKHSSQPNHLFPKITEHRVSVADPLEMYLHRLNEAIAELLIVGLEQFRSDQINTWKTLCDEGQSLGLQRISRLLRKSLEIMQSQIESCHWESQDLAIELLQLAVLIVIAQHQF
jgi:hypothetical protein